MRSTLYKITLTTSLIILVSAQLAGVIHWLYAWSNGIELPQALWQGLITWLKLMATGVFGLMTLIFIMPND